MLILTPKTTDAIFCCLKENICEVWHYGNRRKFNEKYSNVKKGGRKILF